jgi:uncharacterized protein YjbJ (UPF0337 family)
MNWDQIEGNWKQAFGRAKEKWGRLSDDQLAEIGGHKDRLVGKIQEIYGITREEAERQVEDWQIGWERARAGNGSRAYRRRAPGAAAEAAAQWWDDTRRSVAGGAEAMSAALEERPLFVLGCAVGVGFILGLMLGRR